MSHQAQIEAGKAWFAVLLETRIDAPRQFQPTGRSGQAFGVFVMKQSCAPSGRGELMIYRTLLSVVLMLLILSFGTLALGQEPTAE